jgi:hypothetical protein
MVGLFTANTSFGATWAESMFQDLSKDFSSVPRGPMLVYDYRITNNTKETLRISGVRVSCGCVSAAAQKNELKPGEETSVHATMDTNRFIGIKTVYIYVTFTQPRYEEVRLWIQANARTDVSVSPDTFALGQIKRGNGATGNISLTYYGGNGFKITDVTAETNYIQPTFKEIKRGEADVSYQLTATLRADAPVGHWYTDVWVKTNNAAMPKIRVPLNVDIESPLSVNPSTVVLGDVKAGGEAERKVIVRGVTPFKITAIKGTDDQLTVKDSTEEAKALHVLTVKLKAAKPGESNRTLRVITDLKEDGEIEFQTKIQVSQ